MVRRIAYWVATGFLGPAYLGMGYMDIAQPDELVQGAAKIGYPLHFFTLLGVWKLIAGVVVLAPALPRAKEWAYAGMLINLTAASATHAHFNDPPKEVVTPLVILAVAGTSWALRPAGRRLPGPWL